MASRSHLISYAIQHHPSRRDLLWRTAHIEPEVVEDPEPEHTNRNPWRTYRTALERTPECTHRVIIQDDAELCNDFRWAVEQAVKARPDRILCLFMPTTNRAGANALMEACSADEAFAVLPLVRSTDWVPVVAIAWPSAIIPEFLGWCDMKGYNSGKYRADDAIVGSYAMDTEKQVLMTVPSLVEHPDDQDSTIGTRNRVPRRGVCFAGERAHLIDWSS